ncbi:hypothetical protein [Micromonospora okii]|uniref:hypothetical protein n=1 Tax=Micromonospora okii TaxID=1182970 RepID=UPI001E34F2EE|nr:hypothetical protein [Micromonospora okii]
MYQSPYPQHTPAAEEAARQKAGLFRAGKVAAWVWVVLTIGTIALIAICCGLCVLGGALGVVLPAPSPTP